MKHFFLASKTGLSECTLSDANEIAVIGQTPCEALNYFCGSRNQKYLFATARERVYAFDISARPVKITSDVSCEGKVACHLTLSPDEKFLYVANYVSGDVAVFMVDDGKLSFVQLVKSPGLCGPNPARQEAPHAHCTLIMPDGRHLAVADLGCDAVWVYPLTGAGLGKLAAKLITPPGSGPRHLAWASATQGFLFTELSNELYRLNINGKELAVDTAVSTTARGFVKHSQGSAIKISPDQKTVAVANRGEDTIAFFDVETMHEAWRIPAGGTWPRDFEFVDRDRILVCNQNSDTLTVINLRNMSTQTLSVEEPLSTLCV